MERKGKGGKENRMEGKRKGQGRRSHFNTFCKQQYHFILPYPLPSIPKFPTLSPSIYTPRSITSTHSSILSPSPPAYQTDHKLCIRQRCRVTEGAVSVNYHAKLQQRAINNLEHLQEALLSLLAPVCSVLVSLVVLFIVLCCLNSFRVYVCAKQVVVPRQLTGGIFNSVSEYMRFYFSYSTF